MKNWKYISFLPAIALVLLGGYALMHGTVYLLPIGNDNPTNQLIYTLLIIALGLTIPYWVLKLGMHQAHVNDSHEKEIKLKNIPNEQKDPTPVSKR